MNEPSRIVVDASALVEMLSPSPDPDLARRIRTSSAVSPEIIDLEVLQVLRRRERVEPDARANIEHQIRILPTAPISRVPHRPLVPRVWQLRHSVTAYDAAYVALAEQLHAPLVTCDAKLAKAHGHDAVIELYPTDPASEPTATG